MILKIQTEPNKSSLSAYG